MLNQFICEQKFFKEFDFDICVVMYHYNYHEECVT